MKMTSSALTLTWLLVALGTRTTSGSFFDASICTPKTSTVPVPESGAYLGHVWQLEIEWKDEAHNRIYLIKDYADMPDQREKIVISSSFLPDVTLHYDWNTRDTILEETDKNNQGVSQTTCQFIKHKNSGRSYCYRNLFWLTPPQVLINQFSASADAVRMPSKTVRGIQAETWSACIYDYTTNMTVLATLYLSDRSWNFPHIDPNSQVPLRLDYTGRIHNGSQVTDVNLQGDIVSFQKNDIVNDLKFPPEVFSTTEGLFCPNRTGEVMDMHPFPSSLSLTLEIINLNNKRVSYDEFFYDSQLRMIRHDYKVTRGGDPDATSVILDFQVGVKYMIDKHTMRCSSVTQLAMGDEFVTNATLGMKTMASYFHADSATTIQYVGQVTVRNVLCDTWVGHYFDRQANVKNIVQWYFTVNEWWESTGNSAGGGAFFMMKVWAGGSNRPMIYDVMQYNPSSPDFNVFDFSACFDQRSKKHFTIEFEVPAQYMTAYSWLSYSFLKASVVQDLASRLTIQPNRFTDITFDLDKPNNRLFMSSTLLDRSVLTPYNKNEVDLLGAFSFLKGSINGHFIINVTVAGGMIPLIGQSIVVHDYKQEFATTTTPKPASTTILVPTIAPPKKTTRQTTPVPTPPPITDRPSSSSTTTTTTTPTAPVVKTATAVTCPPHTTTPCPAQKPCPNSSSTPCTCPKPSTAPPCKGQQASSSSSGSGISKGAMAGGIVAALVFGLVVGIIITRFYHVMKVNQNQLTINLIDENI